MQESLNGSYLGAGVANEELREAHEGCPNKTYTVQGRAYLWEHIQTNYNGGLAASDEIQVPPHIFDSSPQTCGGTSSSRRQRLVLRWGPFFPTPQGMPVRAFHFDRGTPLSASLKAPYSPRPPRDSAVSTAMPAHGYEIHSMNHNTSHVYIYTQAQRSTL